MAFSLIPSGVYQSIYDLEPECLVRQGITLILADLDNTLARYGQRAPDQALCQWADALRKNGIELFILSNSRKPDRVKEFSYTLRVPYLGHAGKPKTAGFRKALEQTGRRPEETLMVGDQIFTDILGANRTGIRAILVEPIQLAGNPGRYLRYGVETPFRMLGRRRGRG